MNIKHAIDPNTGAEYENKFVALDAIGMERGSCIVDDKLCAALFPARPLQICIVLDGPREALSALLGAATAQALRCTREQKKPARIYAECAPDDTERVVLLNEFGYEDNDGLVRMAREIEATPENPPIPDKLTVLHDFLEDPLEAKYFLMRYNKLFSTEEDMAFVGRLRQLPGFRRYLVIAEEGLVGEVLVSLEDGEGVVHFLHVNPAWRREGVGTYLMKLAVYSLAQRGAKRVRMDVRVRIPGIMRLLKHVGFGQDELLMRYLGIDWNPSDAERMRRAVEERSEALLDSAAPEEAPIAQDPEDWN